MVIKLLMKDPSGEIYLDQGSRWPKYHYTNRPITRMLNFQAKTVVTPGAMYLPVSRYTGIMYGATNKPNDKYCGTFYYSEPESAVLLDMGNVAVFGSKFHASQVLKRSINILEGKGEVSHNEISSKEFKTFINNVAAWGHLYEQQKKELIGIEQVDEQKLYSEYITPFNTFYRECIIPFYNNIYEDPSNIDYMECIKSTAFYPTDKIKYFSNRNYGPGVMDYLDQDICRMARILGIDTLILQRENGKIDTVTEILDTRLNSYEYLFRLDWNTSIPWFIKEGGRFDKDIKNEEEGDEDEDEEEEEEEEEEEVIPGWERYAKVWFTDYGFMQGGYTDLLNTNDFIIDINDSNKVKFGTKY